MKIYIVISTCGIDYEGDSFDILAVCDSMEKAEEIRNEYINSQDYLEAESYWDYSSVDIEEYETNKPLY